MNNLIDLLWGWSSRLTYRVLQFTGTDQANLDSYRDGMKKMQDERDKADKKLHQSIPEVVKEQLPRARIISYVVVFILGIVAVKMFRKYVK